jgi:urease accessory protein
MNAALHDTRTGAEIGRRARLDLRFAFRSGRTVLAHAYAEPPFRVGHCFDEADGAVHLILASSAPGIFPGDRFEQSVVLESGARVRLTSQSSLQIHPGAGSDESSIQSRYQVAPGAVLSCEWHPTIPFAGARFTQRIALDLAGDGRLCWSDAFISGRESRGERWQFARVSHELSVRCNGGLQYLERYVLEPARDALDRRWTADTANYFGTVLAVGCGHTRDAVDELQSSLAAHRDVDAVPDLLEDDLVLVRLMARAGPPFHAARAFVADRWLTGSAAGQNR